LTQAVGCSESQLLYALPGQREEIRSVAERLGVETLLAVCQVLDQTAARLRMSTQVRTLAEMALVRICRLQNLDEVASLVAQLISGEPAAAPPASRGVSPTALAAKPQAAGDSKKNGTHEPAPLVAAAAPAAVSPPPPSPPGRGQGEGEPLTSVASAPAAPPTAPAPAPTALDPNSAEPIWRQALERLTGMVADHAATANRISVDGSGRLVASFPKDFFREACQRNLARIQAALATICGREVGLVLTTHDEPDAAPAAPRPTFKQQQAEIAEQPFVKRAMELFDGDPSRLRIVAPPTGSG
jgi:DNA polymerase-3 subunit gamma/tau